MNIFMDTTKTILLCTAVSAQSICFGETNGPTQLLVATTVPSFNLAERVHPEETTVKTQSFKQMLEKAEHGDVESQIKIGWRYANGEEVEHDDVKAVTWFRKAAEQGSADAQLVLGTCYSKGRGIETNDVEAVAWYRKAADQGLAEAQFELGVCCVLGYGTETNDVEAVEWFRKAAEQGIADAQLVLGTCYSKGRGIETNDVEAVGWYRKAADQGLAEAQFELGLCCALGYGTETNDVEAVEWFRKAAEQGLKMAQVTLGLYHTTLLMNIGSFGFNRHMFDNAYGDESEKRLRQKFLTVTSERVNGIERNDGKAVYWFRRAAENDDCNAQFFLGLCYLIGLGVEPDERNALQWIRAAADHGVPQFQFVLSRLSRLFQLYDFDAETNTTCTNENIKSFPYLMSALQDAQQRADEGDPTGQFAVGMLELLYGFNLNVTQAVEQVAKAAEQGLVDAQFQLGCFYYDGVGVQKDEIKAVEWTRKAAEQGNAEAQYNLGVCYTDGSGVEKDEAKAAEWYRKAADQGHAHAQFCLGDRYDNGVGVEKDETASVEWYRKTAEQGDAAAQLSLGWCYFEGAGVETNKEISIDDRLRQWFRERNGEKHGDNLRQDNKRGPDRFWIMFFLAAIASSVTRSRENAFRAFKESNPLASDADFKVTLPDIVKWMLHGIGTAIVVFVVISAIQLRYKIC